MLNYQTGKNRIFIKAISLIVAQVFFVTSLGYSYQNYNKLRPPMEKIYKRVNAAIEESAKTPFLEL